MTTVKCLLVTMLLAASGAYAAGDTDPLYTEGMFNGRWWRGAGDAMKLGYIAGACQVDGLMAAARRTTAHLCPTGITYVDLRDATNAFYDDAENRAISVYTVFAFVRMKTEGASQSELETFKSNQRKAAHDALTREKK